MNFPQPERAARNLRWLVGWLDRMDYPKSAAIRSDMKTNPHRHLQALGKSHQLCTKVEHVALMFARAERQGIDLLDAGLTHTASALFYVLMQEYEDSGVSVRIVEKFRKLHIECLRGYFIYGDDQIRVFCAAQLDLTAIVTQVLPPGGSITLLNFPVGNSVPVKLLAQSLRRNYRVTVQTVSLPRQNAARNRALTEALAGKLAGTELVIHFDEWNSGVNFDAICTSLRRLMPAGVRFLPFAVRTNSSANHPDYAYFCARHDRLLNLCGAGAHNCRPQLPAIPTALNGDDCYFFWSENDRMSGYRKLQSYGLVFSTLDNSIEALRNNPALLSRTITVQASIMIRGAPPGVTLPAIRAELRSSFDAGYADYHECRNALRAAGAPFARGGRIEFGRELDAVMDAQNRIVSGRPAMQAVVIAWIYLATLSGLDPGHRYAFQDHTPGIFQLRGRARVTHEFAIEYLKEVTADVAANGV